MPIFLPDPATILRTASLAEDLARSQRATARPGLTL